MAMLIGAKEGQVDTSGIRRFVMVVEDFGTILAGRGRAMGPVYSTPEGAQFYDVTDGLTNVTGREHFAIEDGKLQILDDAKRALKKIEERYVSPPLLTRKPHAGLVYDCLRPY